MIHSKTIIEAESKGWVDLFVQDGKVWGYASPSDVIPQVFPVKKAPEWYWERHTISRNSEGLFHLPQIDSHVSVSTSGLAQLEFDGLILEGYYSQTIDGFLGQKENFRVEHLSEANWDALRQLGRGPHEARLSLCLPRGYLSLDQSTSKVVIAHISSVSRSPRAISVEMNLFPNGNPHTAEMPL